MATIIHRTTLELRTSVNTPDYDPSEWIINPDLRSVAGVPTQYWKVDPNNSDGVVTMTRAEMDTMDSARLPALKQVLVDAVDDEIERRIHDGPGFEWPANSGVFFSLSANAQTKWVGLMVAKDLLTYPLTVPSRHDDVFYDIKNAAEAQEMYVAATSAIKRHLVDGTAAKAAVRKARSVSDAQDTFNKYMNPSVEVAPASRSIGSPD